MRRLTTFALSIAALVAVAGSCAKSSDTGQNYLTKKYFDAWMATNHPGVQKTGLGIYILEDTPGDGDLVSDEDTHPYVYATYTITDLEGNVTSTSSSVLSQQLGSYDPTYYYGDYVLDRSEGAMYAGINSMLSTMRVGGTRTAVVPGWLISTDVYDTEDEYLENCTGTDAIYTLSVHEVFDDVTQWELDSLERYMAHNYPGVDTVMTGFYYIQLKAPSDTAAFSDDETVYINYTGKLLNGQAFDTTLEDVAKQQGLYSSSTEYAPTYVTWNDDYTEITMGESSTEIISGFAKCISMMRKGEVGMAIFHSAFGYESSGSGDSIPGYSPLIFEIQCLGTEETDTLDD